MAEQRISPSFGVSGSEWRLFSMHITCAMPRAASPSIFLISCTVVDVDWAIEFAIGNLLSIR